MEEKNKSLELRTRPKRNDPSLQAYVKYPAVLTVERSKQHKCNVERTF